jgi:hypothetical protein
MDCRVKPGNDGERVNVSDRWYNAMQRTDRFAAFFD